MYRNLTELLYFFPLVMEEFSNIDKRLSAVGTLLRTQTEFNASILRSVEGIKVRQDNIENALFEDGLYEADPELNPENPAKEAKDAKKVLN